MSSLWPFFSENKPSLFVIKGDYAQELYHSLVDHSTTNGQRSDVITIGGARDGGIDQININTLTRVEMETLLRQSIAGINERQMQAAIKLS